MRILLLTHRLPYAPNRGDRIRAFHLFQQLAARHDVQLVSLVHDDEEWAELEKMKQRTGAEVIGVRVRRWQRLLPAAAGLAGSRPLTHLLLHTPRIVPRLAALVDRGRPDVVVAYCTGMARYALEHPLRGIPWLLDMVDVDSEKWAALAEAGGPARLVYRREAHVLRVFEGVAMRSAFATTVVTERERLLLQRNMPGAAVSVVSNGIDLRTFAPAEGPANTLDVAFCGVFDYAPNVAAALWLARDVWPRVLREIPEARLKLVGMNPTNAVRALASGSIEVTGAVPDVRPFLWNSAVAVAPLLVARGLQNKVLEALAAGLPCVVTPAVFEGLPPSVHQGCEVASDPDAFAAAIVRRLQDPPEARRALAARAALEPLAWEKQLAPMLDLIDRRGLDINPRNR